MCKILWYLCGNELYLPSKGFSWLQLSETYIISLFPEDNVICKISLKFFFWFQLIVLLKIVLYFVYYWRVTMKGIIKSNKRQYFKATEAMHRIHMAIELLSKSNRCIISWPGFLSHQLLSCKLTFNSAMLNQIK